MEKCDDPRCFSRLVIVPKLDPGMPKDAPPTSYRVTMDALLNNCLKPVASTLPLATDEIKKLHGKRFFLSWTLCTLSGQFPLTRNPRN